MQALAYARSKLNACMENGNIDNINVYMSFTHSELGVELEIYDPLSVN